ncbi:uncharacterized protein VTP21DRAFT_1900 [Calcarisporiella thermophila]|uniref:uncharacterized protein n=1 Tax=Calcarisporiella thermophila TaxID=911321 RepID=UPI0037436348
MTEILKPGHPVASGNGAIRPTALRIKNGSINNRSTNNNKKYHHKCPVVIKRLFEKEKTEASSLQQSFAGWDKLVKCLTNLVHSTSLLAEKTLMILSGEMG